MGDNLNMELHIQSLRERIISANTAYSEGKPFLTDAEYDELWRELHSLCPNDSILYHTGGFLNDSEHQKISHPRKLLSLSKAFTIADLRIFLTRYSREPLVVGPKLDGVSAVYYPHPDKPILSLAGDGLIGHDVSHRLRDINLDILSYPERGYKDRDLVEGEIVIPTDCWDENYGANPRNVVAGWMNPKSTAYIPHRRCMFIPHDYFDKPIKTSATNLNEFEEFLLETLCEWRLAFPCDGLVLKVSDGKRRAIDGHNQTFPYWAIAWKPPIETAETRVVQIEWNIARTGRVVPTIVYEPIRLCGTTNTRVTGNNAKWVWDKNISVDSTITIGKAGEIIPKIIDVRPIPGRVTTLPDACPYCGEPLTWIGIDLFCGGSACLPKEVARLNYFYLKGNTYFEGIGLDVFERLLKSELRDMIVSKPWCLLYARVFRDKLAKILSLNTVLNILTAAETIKPQLTSVLLLRSLGIPKVGAVESDRIIRGMKGLKTKAPSQDALTSFINHAGLYISMIKDLESNGVEIVPLVNWKTKYTITGEFDSHSRDEIIVELAKQGWAYSASGVTSDVEVLLLGRLEHETKKLKKAKELGIRIVTSLEEVLNADESQP